MAQDTSLVRTYALDDFEVRSSTEGRVIEGWAVPFGQWADINSPREGKFREQFRYGAFARSIADGKPVKLLVNHDRQSLPVGRSISLREDPQGLFASFLVARNADGEALLGLVQDKIVDSFSVSFAPVRDEWNRSNSEVTRIEARLIEVSAVGFPAFAGAAITGTRSRTFLPSARSRWVQIQKMKGHIL